MFVFQKTVDRSTLREGFAIPIAYQQQFHRLVEGELVRGEKITMGIILEGVEYGVTLKNQIFDANVHQGHVDIMQVRYSPNSPFAQRLREVFDSSWQYVEEIKALPENRHRKLKVRIPLEQQEYLVLHATNRPLVFEAECITAADKRAMTEGLKQMNEVDFETFTPIVDPTATIKESLHIQRIRRLDRSIGDSLKRLYNYTCQMTGEEVGQNHGVHVVEAHHIVPFTESLNNDTDNLIILSPTYHRIVHAANPVFDRKSLSFVYPNGLVERVKVDRHLKKR